MILIISESLEHSTGEVIAWLNYYGFKWFRVNDYHFVKNLKSELLSKKKDFEFFIDGVPINYKDIYSIWYRRIPDVTNNPYIFPSNTDNQDLCHSAYQELRPIFYFFLSILNKKKWLGDPDLSTTNKLHNLKLASELGINIPDTIITSNKAELLNFRKNHKKIIVKPLHAIVKVLFKNTPYRTYTTLISDKWLKHLPDNFFPSLFQKYINKQYEIRTFFINNNFYSMAIFSQADKQTSIDFRNYNYEKPTRRVPYKLPKKFEDKLREFMKLAYLNTGSIDIIRNEKNEYVFLEVNPVGQFGMVSKPCNYYLEQKIANFLNQ